MTWEDGKLGAAARSAFGALQELRDAHQAASQRSLALQGLSLRWRQVVLFLGSLLAIVAFLVFGALLSSRLGAGLRAVLQATQLMALGDLDWNIGLKSGDELESIAGALHRITRNMKKLLAARREADEQLQRAAQDLKETKALLAAGDKRLAATLALVDRAILTCDGAGRVLALNLVAERWTGWTQEAALGQPISQVCCVASARTHERCQDLLQRAVQSGGILSLADPTVLVARDGVERSVHVASTALHDAEGHLTGAVFVLREDVKEHEQ
jgi:PAS domain S-box-containing protein